MIVLIHHGIHFLCNLFRRTFQLKFLNKQRRRFGHGHRLDFVQHLCRNLRNAFVAVEDARFYTHNGIDIKRIIGSFVQNFVSGSQQGGSTITQQLIKNTLLSSELSYKRKIQEAWLAMQLETRYTKLQILEYYLNTIYLGENYYGVQVAAQGYFGKELHELTLRECAMLAGMTRSPNYYNPRRNFYTLNSDGGNSADITNNRTDYVLRQMREHGLVTVNDENHIYLTPEGKAIAARIFERHEVLTNMLVRLGVSRETAMHDACKIEHDLSDETFDAIKRHMEQYGTPDMR